MERLLKQPGRTAPLFAPEGVVHAARLPVPPHGRVLRLDRNRNDALVEMEPGIKSGYRGLILSFEQRGEYAKAIEQEVLSIQPGDPHIERRKRDADRLRRSLASGGERG